MEKLFKPKAENNLKLAGKNYGKGLANLSKAIEPINTIKEVSKISGIGSNTLKRVKAIEEKAPEVVKEKLYNQEISVNQAYKCTEAI